MSNINYEIKGNQLTIEYSTLHEKKTFIERGSLTGDCKQFIVESHTIQDAPDLSETEKLGLKKYVMGIKKGDYPSVVFTDL